MKAVAIGFLHAYAHDDHERRVREVLAAALPKDVTICISSEVAPEIREFERFSTVVANAYVRPLMAGYLHRLRDQLREHEHGLPAVSHDVRRRPDHIGNSRALSHPPG